MQIEELDNNKYRINGVLIYAPNVNTAILRYKRGQDEKVI